MTKKLPIKTKKVFGYLFIFEMYIYWNDRKKYKNKDKPIVKLETKKGQSHCIPLRSKKKKKKMHFWKPLENALSIGQKH